MTPDPPLDPLESLLEERLQAAMEEQAAPSARQAWTASALLDLGSMLETGRDVLRAMRRADRDAWRLLEAEKKLSEAVFWLEEQVGEG